MTKFNQMVRGNGASVCIIDMNCIVAYSFCTTIGDDDREIIACCIK